MVEVGDVRGVDFVRVVAVHMRASSYAARCYVVCIPVFMALWIRADLDYFDIVLSW